MPHKLRKTRKTRGSRTQGYGRIGQHRKTGSKGYRKAGRHKHTWSYVTTHEPNYFGKHGFTSRQSLTRKTKTINIAQLEAFVTEGETQTIDLTKLGYTKLLGTGKVTKPLDIKIQASTKTATQKIEQAGGKVLTPTSEAGE